MFYAFFGGFYPGEGFFYCIKISRNIDPPYNTGARDWKYNNDYVDNSDQYRHSKWLSFMQKRLKLAKKLLNPEDSVLIVTIDEKEYLHLGCLLEEMFPEAKMQMVSSVINPKGSARDGFSRCDEYLFFVMFGNGIPSRLPLTNEWAASAIVAASVEQDDCSARSSEPPRMIEPGWTSMMRRGTGSLRTEVPTLYYNQCRRWQLYRKRAFTALPNDPVEP